MKHIVQFSGGKDSTCMLLMMLEKGMQVDEITFCDTGKEFPAMYDHIEQVRKDIKKFGKDITILRSEHPYDWWMFEKPKVAGKWKDCLGYGWAMMHNRWCTRVMKQEVLQKHMKEQGEHILYLGIAWDEQKRHERIKKNQVHPLCDWGITEKMALSFCKGHGYTWGGLYDKFRRVSCWCCPLQPISELRKLYHYYPDLWQTLKEMDARCRNQFKANYTVEELENRFKREDYLKKISIPLFTVNTDDY